MKESSVVVSILGILKVVQLKENFCKAKRPDVLLILIRPIWGFKLTRLLVLDWFSQSTRAPEKKSISRSLLALWRPL